MRIRIAIEPAIDGIVPITINISILRRLDRILGLPQVDAFRTL